MMAMPMKTLKLHYPMIRFLIKYKTHSSSCTILSVIVSNKYVYVTNNVIVAVKI